MERISMKKNDPKVDYAIYGLTDPRDAFIRYIGISNNVYRRFREHVQHPYSPSHKDTWIHGLLEQGMLPGLVILEIVQGEASAREREEYWIGLYTYTGMLLNWNLNEQLRNGGTRIDDPDLAAHVSREITEGRQ
jgi:hypothetical protein